MCVLAAPLWCALQATYDTFGSSAAAAAASEAAAAAAERPSAIPGAGAWTGMLMRGRKLYCHSDQTHDACAVAGCMLCFMPVSCMLARGTPPLWQHLLMACALKALSCFPVISASTTPCVILWLPLFVRCSAPGVLCPCEQQHRCAAPAEDGLAAGQGHRQQGRHQHSSSSSGPRCRQAAAHRPGPQQQNSTSG